MSQTHSILIVDDHAMMVDGIVSLIEKIDGFECVGTASNGVEAIRFIEKTIPSVVITDVNMPEMNGIELTEKLKATNPEIKILVLTMYNEGEIVKEIVNAGANGCILKNTGKDELKNALESVINGGTFFSQEVVQTMMTSLKNEGTKDANLNSPELTEREKEIVTLIAKEQSSAEIADQLFISIRTVETHRKNIIKKTGVKNVVGLVKLAYDNGWVK